MPTQRRPAWSGSARMFYRWHPRPGGRMMAAVKGAPHAILDRCTQWVQADGSVVPLTAHTRARIVSVNETMAAEGLRVIAIADGCDDAAAPRARHCGSTLAPATRHHT